MSWLRACVAATGFAMMTVAIASLITAYVLFPGNGRPDYDSYFAVMIFSASNQLILALAVGFLIATFMAFGRRVRWWFVPTSIILVEFALLVTFHSVFEVEQDIDGPVMTPFALSIIASFFCVVAAHISYCLMRRTWIRVRWPARARPV